MKIKHLLFILAFIVIFVPCIVYLDEVKVLSEKCFSMYGFPGLTAMVIVMDIIIQPISPDVVIISSTLGGARLLWASLFGGLGSIIAGVVGYSIGRKIGSRGFKRLFTEKHLEKGEALFKKYGIWAVAVGALTPVPFSAVCWSAGIYRMKFPIFVITSIVTRIPRFFIMAFIGSFFYHR